MKQRIYGAVLSTIAIAVSGAAQADQSIECTSPNTPNCQILIDPQGGGNYRIDADVDGIGIGDGLGGLPFVILNNAPGASLVIDSSGNLSSGAPNQPGSLRIRRNNGTAKLMLQETNGTVATRRLVELRNNGPIAFAMINTNQADEWRLAAQTTGFRITNAASPGPDFEVLKNGDAVLRGTLTEGSDVNVKSDIEALDGNLVLAKLDALPVTEWSYRWESPSVRHIGPMAQDFHAAFGLGNDETKISPRDMAGVTMAAVKALRSELVERDAEIAAQREQISALQARVGELDRLKDQIAAIESRLPNQMATRN
jgi:hypothetical protein